MRRGPGIDRDRRIYEKTQRSVEDNIRTDDNTGAAVVHPGDDTLRRVHDTGQADIGFQLHVWFSGRHHTDVSVECKSLISGDDTSNDVKSLLSVNSSNYEKPTQTTTQATTQAQAQAPQQKVVVVHDNAPAPSNNGGYVCLGLSMNEAYNLMTPSEKAIVANNANDRALVNEQYAKHGYCFSKDYWHNYFYGYTH